MELQKSRELCDKFFALEAGEKRPIIKDVRLLPASKKELWRAFSILLHETQKSCASPLSDMKYEEYLARLTYAQGVMLGSYLPIDENDQAAVDVVNRLNETNSDQACEVGEALICKYELRVAEISDIYSKGRECEELRDYERGMLEYSKIIALDPANSAAYWRRGSCYWHLKQSEDAIKDLDEAIELDPTSPAFSTRGFVFTGLLEFENAIEDFTAVIALEPEEAYMFRCRGIAYLELGKTSNAFDDFTESIKLNPNDAHVFYKRGHVHYELGRFVNAIEDYTSAIELASDVPRYYWMRGNCHDALESIDEAVSDFSVVLKQDVDNYLSELEDLGISSEMASAERYLSLAIENGSSNHLVFEKRCICFMKKRMFAEANQEWDAAKSLGANNEPLENLLKIAESVNEKHLELVLLRFWRGDLSEELLGKILTMLA